MDKHKSIIGIFQREEALNAIKRLQLNGYDNNSVIRDRYRRNI